MKKSYTEQMYVGETTEEFLQAFDSLFGCSATPKKTLEIGEWVPVEFSIDREAISRGAGRPRRDRDLDIPVSKVYKYAQHHTQKETAAWLGLSLRTYQRYVKSLEAYGMWRADVRDLFGKQS